MLYCFSSRIVDKLQCTERKLVCVFGSTKRGVFTLLVFGEMLYGGNNLCNTCLLFCSHDSNRRYSLVYLVLLMPATNPAEIKIEMM